MEGAIVSQPAGNAGCGCRCGAASPRRPRVDPRTRGSLGHRAPRGQLHSRRTARSTWSAASSSPAMPSSPGSAPATGAPTPFGMTAHRLGIASAAPDTPRQLCKSLLQSSYGQGQVVASPLQMARDECRNQHRNRRPRAAAAAGARSQSRLHPLPLPARSRPSGTGRRAFPRLVHRLCPFRRKSPFASHTGGTRRNRRTTGI